MVDPVTAGIVVGFLADRVLGTVVEKYTEGAIAKINGLLGRVWERLRGNQKVEQARQALEAQDPAAQGNLERYFLNEMEEDAAFKTLIEEIAAEIQAGEKAASDGVTVNVSDQATANVWSNPNNQGEIYQGNITINKLPDP